MIINESLLLSHGAECIEYEVNEIIFHEGTTPKFYYQIVEGIVELKNYHDEGKEFTHNILSSGQCFGESLLLNERSYPMTAVAQTPCKILKLSKIIFLDLLQQNPQVALNMFKCLADRLYYKYIMLFNISSNNPSQQLKTLMDYYRDYNFNGVEKSNKVPFTRKQLANLTGLRIETVIRTVKKMEKDRILKIENGKIYYS
ncbi:Crp/Fnr family transcriptional regulator [Chryseobacterium oranimense]|uniref:Crp/Fnr family transcriptional regulator n=1 Tax=Chryseobacterium oranimense TaxID=421058 RepID=UPI0031E3F30B